MKTARISTTYGDVDVMYSTVYTNDGSGVFTLISVSIIDVLDLRGYPLFSDPIIERATFNYEQQYGTNPQE